MKRYLILAALLLAACATTFSVVEPGRIAVTDLYSVQPSIKWSSVKVDNGQVWTVDGFALQALRFVGGVKDGGVYFEAPDKKRKIPFRADMTETEIAEMVVDEFSLSGAKNVELQSLRPQKFGTIDGFGFDIDYVTGDGVEAHALVVGTVHDSTLYLILYTGTSLHYFDRYADEAKSIIDSIKLES